MSYISQEDYKNLMNNFQKGSPKGLLKEDFERPDTREAEEEDELGRITDVVEAVFANDKKTSRNTVDALAEEIRNKWAESRGYGQGNEIDFAVEYLKDWVSEARSAGDGSGLGGGSKLSRRENDTIWGDDWESVIDNAANSLEEGNAFTAGLAKTKRGGEFKVGDKKMKDTSNYDASINEGICPSCGMPADQCQCGQEMDESHVGMDKWYEDFENGLQNLVKNGYMHKNQYQYFRDALDHVDPMQDYGHMSAHDAAKEFVDDLRTKDAIDHDKEQFDRERGFEEEVSKLQEIAGVRSHDDGPEDEDSEEDREAGRKKREMDDEEAENAERDEFDENAEGKLNLRDPLAAAKNVATKYKAELKPKFDEYQESYEEYIQAIRKYDNTDPEFREITKVHNALVKAFQGNVLGLARQEMEDAGEKPVVAKNLAYGYSDEDWPSEFVTALNKELKGVAESLKEGAGYEDPFTLARAVALAHPELQKFALEDRKMFQRAAFKYAFEMMLKSGVSKVATNNLISGAADEDWPSDYISALGEELEGMQEGLHMPPLQATGNTVMTNEEQAPFGMSVLSPDEREQLKEYINHYRTIKSEISKLLGKAGKSGKIMENVKKAEDENVPAERKAKYRNPTEVPVQHKKSNLGGNRTGLVMTKGEMYENEGHGEGEHERIEGMLDMKLHTAFHKVTGMIMKDLMDDGFDGGDIKNFLQYEIEKKAKEATMSQHD